LQVNNKIVFSLIAVIISGCSTYLPSAKVIGSQSSEIDQKSNNPENPVTILSAAEFKELENEYSAFSTKALSEAYLLKKILKWKDLPNGLKMVKEIDYARQRHPDLLKAIMLADHNLFLAVNAMPEVSAKRADSTFNDFMAELSGTPVFYDFNIFFNRNGDIFTLKSDNTNLVQITNTPEYESDVQSGPDLNYGWFKSSENGFDQIFRVNKDGSNKTRITSQTNQNYQLLQPTLDGSKIFFRLNNSIYVKNSDGSGSEINISQGPADSIVSVSPDGSKAAIQKSNNGATPLIYLNSTQGNDFRKLTTNFTEDEFLSSGFFWPYDGGFSPDGSKLIFRKYLTGNYHTFIGDWDTLSFNRIDDPSNPFTHMNGVARWSPDSTRFFLSQKVFTGSQWYNHIYSGPADLSSPPQDITPGLNFDAQLYGVFEVNNQLKLIYYNQDSQNQQTYVINSDGTGVINLSQNIPNPGWPLILNNSNNHKVFLFDNGPNGSYSRIYSINFDGTGLTNLSGLTNSQGGLIHESIQLISTKNNKIIINSDRDGSQKYYVENTDGTEPLQLSNISQSDFIIPVE
jgi:Tol biopolymer transport system component